MSTPTFVGLDVARDHIDVALHPTDRAFRVSHDVRGLAQLVEELRATGPTLAVLEATGGLETDVAAALAVADVPVAIINPRQVRDFAKALGRLAKTDTIDAKVLALFAARVQPTPRALPDEARQALVALVTRRRQLVEMHTAEHNRLKRARSTTHRDLRQHLRWLERHLRDLDRELAQLIRHTPLWHAQERLLRSVPGIGPITAAVVIAQLPELGQLTRRQIASLVGCAPLNRDSGRFRGPRATWGGRAAVRQPLYMATLVATQWNPVIRRFYQRLCAAGKHRKVARIAAMRKLLTILNAIFKYQRPWSPVSVDS